MYSANEIQQLREQLIINKNKKTERRKMKLQETIAIESIMHINAYDLIFSKQRNKKSYSFDKRGIEMNSKRLEEKVIKEKTTLSAMLTISYYLALYACGSQATAAVGSQNHLKARLVLFYGPRCGRLRSLHEATYRPFLRNLITRAYCAEHVTQTENGTVYFTFMSSS